jgi:hypothetical protein
MAYTFSRTGYTYTEADKHRDNLRSILGYENVDHSGARVYDGKGSDILGRDRDLEYSGKHLSQNLQQMQDLGLTPQEIVGSPAAGGTTRSGGNQTLGQSGSASHAAKIQAQTAANQQRIQANTAIQVAKINAQATLGAEQIRSGVNIRGQDVQAKTQLGAQSVIKRGQDVQRSNFLEELARKRLVDREQISKIQAEAANVMQDTYINRVVHTERWQRLFSTMSSENVMASVIAVMSGVSIGDVLRNAPDQDRDALQKFIDQVISSKSKINIETEGITQIISQALRDMF